ncbi:MAG: OmpH family outer membrane protein [Planctomycetota bacterium]
MKYKLFVTVLVVLAAALTVAEFVTGADTQRSAGPASEKTAPAQEAKCLKIGIVSVRRIFQDCKRNVKYRRELAAERDKLGIELERLSKEIDLDKTGLKTLKPGSPDYLSAMKEVLEKQARLQAQQEFFKRQMDIREQAIIESLFNDVVNATAEVAKEKMLDLVLEKSEPELPAANSNELMLTISTHKVLYSAGCEDVTDAVLAKVDAADKSAN